MDWLIANKEWLFSGALVAVPLALVGWIIGKRAIQNLQKQRAGHSSVNIQAGGNVNLGGADDKAGTDKRR